MSMVKKKNWLPVGLMACLGLWAATGLAQEKAPLTQQGEKVYRARCADCHRSNGQGLPNIFPALAGSDFVTGAPQGVIQIILEGRRGNMGRMPAWKTTLDDQEIAAVVTYIRQAWGNQAEAVSAAEVGQQRR